MTAPECVSVLTMLTVKPNGVVICCTAVFKSFELRAPSNSRVIFTDSGTDVGRPSGTHARLAFLSFAVLLLVTGSRVSIIPDLAAKDSRPLPPSCRWKLVIAGAGGDIRRGTCCCRLGTGR